MTVREIVTYPSEILEKECERVTTFDKNLVKLLKDMYDTMIEYDGAGLAAPQIGINKQIVVIDIGDEWGRIELINPVIIEKKGEQTGAEGCLSFPGIFGEVTRSYYVKVKAQDRKGRPFIIEGEDFLARAMQHEIDHLHGVLFTSKVKRYLTEEELERLE